MPITEDLSHFFTDFDVVKLAKGVSVLREDGIALYSSFKDQKESAKVGALAVGVWQAATTLGAEKGSGQYRLSFETSSSGFFILPLRTNRESFILCMQYEDELNPAKTKQQVKKIAILLQKYLNEKKSGNNSESKNARAGYLFSDITDDEMDGLFGLN